MSENENFALFLRTENYLCQEGYQQIAERSGKRMKCPLVPVMTPTRLEDRERNRVYITAVKTDQADDVVKALRKIGTTSKVFKYDKAAWDAEKRELVTLQE